MTEYASVSAEDQRIVKQIVKLLVDEWLPGYLVTRIEARLPYAIVDGEQRPDGVVVYHDASAIR